ATSTCCWITSQFHGPPTAGARGLHGGWRTVFSRTSQLPCSCGFDRPRPDNSPAVPVADPPRRANSHAVAVAELPQLSVPLHRMRRSCGQVPCSSDWLGSARELVGYWVADRPSPVQLRLRRPLTAQLPCTCANAVAAPHQFRETSR